MQFAATQSAAQLVGDHPGRVHTGKGLGEGVRGGVQVAHRGHQEPAAPPLRAEWFCGPLRAQAREVARVRPLQAPLTPTGNPTSQSRNARFSGRRRSSARACSIRSAASWVTPAASAWPVVADPAPKSNAASTGG